MRCGRRKEHSRWQERERVSGHSDSNRTVMRCNPHSIQSCLSFTDVASSEDSSAESGLTRSVMMYIVPSASTASMNLRMSGCRVTRSLRREF